MGSNRRCVDGTTASPLSGKEAPCASIGTVIRIGEAREAVESGKEGIEDHERSSAAGEY